MAGVAGNVPSHTKAALSEPFLFPVGSYTALCQSRRQSRKNSRKSHPLLPLRVSGRDNSCHDSCNSCNPRKHEVQADYRRASAGQPCHKAGQHKSLERRQGELFQVSKL